MVSYPNSVFSPGFKKFVKVICSMNGDERKAFLQFATGCSSLPPGGLANLNPRLTIVRKVTVQLMRYVFLVCIDVISDLESLESK